MKATICYEVTRTYYQYETIEADSLEEAHRIGRKLLDSTSFIDRLDDYAEYEGRDASVGGVWDDDARVTLEQDEIDDYMKEA